MVNNTGQTRKDVAAREAVERMHDKSRELLERYRTLTARLIELNDAVGRCEAGLESGGSKARKDRDGVSQQLGDVQAALGAISRPWGESVCRFHDARLQAISTDRESASGEIDKASRAVEVARAKLEAAERELAEREGNRVAIDREKTEIEDKQRAPFAAIQCRISDAMMHLDADPECNADRARVLDLIEGRWSQPVPVSNSAARSVLPYRVGVIWDRRTGEIVEAVVLGTLAGYGESRAGVGTTPQAFEQQVRDRNRAESPEEPEPRGESATDGIRHAANTHRAVLDKALARRRRAYVADEDDEVAPDFVEALE